MVSVVVIALNEAKNLNELFDCLYQQTYKNLEVILVDDPRTNDETKSIVKQWQEKLQIRHIYKNDKPGKLGNARLNGAKEAFGEFIFQIDADMRQTPSVIEDCVEQIKNGADGVYINEEVIGEGFWTRVKWLEKKCYFYDEEVCSPRFFNKKSYFDVGGHNPNLAFSEDLDIKLKMQENNKKLAWTDEIMFHNEKKLKLLKSARNKFFWAQSALDFISIHPAASAKQGNVFLRPAFIRNWKLLISHPLLTLGIFIMKFAEALGALLGIITVKIFKKNISYKTMAK